MTGDDIQLMFYPCLFYLIFSIYHVLALLFLAEGLPDGFLTGIMLALSLCSMSFIVAEYFSNRALSSNSFPNGTLYICASLKMQENLGWQWRPQVPLAPRTGTRITEGNEPSKKLI